MAGGKASVHKIEVAEQKKKALTLRLAGMSYRGIGENLGLGMATAHRYVLSELAKIPKEEADKVREIERERLDNLQVRLEKKLRGDPTKGLDGDPAVIPNILRVMERRARMLGLDAPTATIIDGIAPLIVKFETVKASEAPAQPSPQKPNPNIQPPPYDRATEGYDPSKVKNKGETVVVKQAKTG